MSTVTRIVSVNENVFPPAIAELVTSESERFPIFDGGVLIDAKYALDRSSSVLLLLQPSRHASAGYVRKILLIDITAESMPCIRCYRVATRREAASDANGGVDQFVCPNCAHRLYLAPVRSVVIELPAVARARLTEQTDGIYALDHQQHEATLMDECDCAMPHAAPWRGILAELTNGALTFLTDPQLRGQTYQVI